jgi:hypothetical protein
MMPDMIKKPTRREAWLAGVEYLLKCPGKTDLNLVLVIESPGAHEPAFEAATHRVDRFLHEEGQPPLHTVAEYIFPGWAYHRRGLRGVFETYPDEEYPVLRAAKPTGWGTYAYRLVRRTTADGSVINPLERLIDKLKAEMRVKGSKTACYELSLAEGAYDLPLYNTVDDDHRHMGGPCLSHISFKLYDGAVHLSAFYRSHDYRYKALGNLLGLARLQACVVHETGLKLGTLVVHSSYAWIDQGKGVRKMQSLLSDLRKLEVHEAQSNRKGAQ